MPWNGITFKRRLAAILLVLCSAGRAAEVSWIGGSTCPARWSIQPTSPTEADVIRFSGPAGFHLSQSVAERKFGGRPAIRFDSTQRRIELRYEPPPSETQEGFWSPVCGLEGSFGPLEPGQWEFVCQQEAAAFSIPFEVTATATVETVLYVDANAVGEQTGLTWADALVDLQTALSLATAGTEIRVARGVYVPRDVGLLGDDGMIGDPDPDAAFHLKNGVILKGGHAGSSGPNPNERDLLAYESVLSGDLYGNDGPFAHLSDMLDPGGRSDNTYHVVTAVGTDATAVLDGFTITGGYAFGSPLPDRLSCGGGIYIEGGSPTIRNCLIIGNAVKHYGAGVYTSSQCRPTFLDCVIADNWSDWWGGGLFNDGSDVYIERSLISGNRAAYHGGGIFNHTNGCLTLANCVLSGNLAVEPYWGRGGALYNSLAELRLRHCTLAGNRAAQGPTLACDSHGQENKSDIQATNCILWDAPEGIWNNDDSPLAISYSDVQGGSAGAGNLHADPCFIDPGSWDRAETPEDPCDDRWSEGDYRLRWESPCVDAGDPLALPDPNARDFFGRPRLSGRAVDLGACELTNDPPIADAGPNVGGFSLDGVRGNVTLDGSRSFDPEGQPLLYRWYQEGSLVGEGERFTIERALGDHEFSLVVDDGVNVSEPDEVLASVTLVVDVPMVVSPTQIRRDTSAGSIVALALAPKGRTVSELDTGEPILLFPGGIEALTQAATLSLTRRTLILANFDLADVLPALPQEGSVELRIVGRFKDGQFFSGVTNVEIK